MYIKLYLKSFMWTQRAGEPPSPTNIISKTRQWHVVELGLRYICPLSHTSPSPLQHPRLMYSNWAIYRGIFKDRSLDKLRGEPAQRKCDSFITGLSVGSLAQLLLNLLFAVTWIIFRGGTEDFNNWIFGGVLQINIEGENKLDLKKKILDVIFYTHLLMVYDYTHSRFAGCNYMEIFKCLAQEWSTFVYIRSKWGEEV